MENLKSLWRSGLMKCLQKSVRLASRLSSARQTDILDTLYSPEEKDRIIDCFNRCSVQELRVSKQLNLAKASSIVKYREEHGDFESLSAIVKVPGLGVLGLQKVCDFFKNFSYETVHKLNLSTDHGSVKSNPPITKIVRENMKSLVAMDVQCDRVCWTWMDRDLHVLDWSHSSVFDKHFQKYDHVTYLEKIHETMNTLPEADIYVMESKILHLPNLRVAPFIMSLKLTEAILCVLLNKDFVTTQTHKVYTTPSRTVSRFFGLSMGGERVSGQHIVRDIVNNSSEIVKDVQLPQTCWDTYRQLKAVDQENYANSLLLGIAFYKLLILRTHYETGEKCVE
ncbi:transcription elongation factor, mitochondrial-like [Gigantopelta aegis]|uniref:transcription elongation factor, mitochondrial-like n=1 Tax=Gigantopelta aegis TaxID=1735272 RepID=UPI001B888CDF|nr:transcription elongation factor, mitochondrial-like [Gigantopelta aegis]